MSDPYLGEIRMVGFNFAPYGWALCQGEVLAISQNQALFSLLGTYYGGNGTTTFQLPDLRSRTPVGTGQGAGLSAVEIGQIGGTENASLTTQNMPLHTHVATVSTAGAAQGSISIPASTSTDTSTQSAVPGNTSVLGSISVANRQGDLYSTVAADTTLKPFDVNLPVTAPTIQNGPAGGSTPFSLRNPYIGINFIIALTGVFPSRG